MGLPSAPLALQAPLTSGLCPEHPSSVPPTCLLLIQILAQITLSKHFPDYSVLESCLTPPPENVIFFRALFVKK